MLLVALLAAVPSQAALFEDDEARRAILDLRQRMESNRKAIEASLNEALSNQAAEQRRLLEEQRRGSEELHAALRRSLLELSGQIETLRGEIARLRGQNEQLARDISEVQRRQKDLAEVSMKVDERMRKLEPAQVSVDGRDFLADPAEKAEYEAALAVFRKGQFAAAQSAFAEFGRRYPSSGYRPSALYWLGNSQYATREYKEAIASFRAFLAAAPDHVRAPDALLSVANCQIELKDLKAARKTLGDVGVLYAQSEAAQAAKERLSRLK